MRLRELYYSEHGLQPWRRTEKTRISEWIGAREALWSEIDGEPFGRIEMEGTDGAPLYFDPFDPAGINAILADRMMVYGAGYGPGLQATFFLAEIIGREKIDGLEIYTCGREYARDLSAPPAMLAENTVFARLESNENLIWQKFQEYKAKPSGLLHVAFSHYGLASGHGRPADADSETDPEAARMLSAISMEELRTYIKHELGEAAERKRLGPAWAELLLGTRDARHAVFLRAVKDVLADTCPEGMLRHIVDTRKTGSLAFYAAFLAGYRKPLSARMEKAIGLFFEKGTEGSRDGWAGLGKAVGETHEETKAIASKILQSGSPAQLIGDAIKKLSPAEPG